MNNAAGTEGTLGLSFAQLAKLGASLGLSVADNRGLHEIAVT